MIEKINCTSKIHFDVSFSEPQAHYADIKMSITEIQADFIDVKMPVWSPGSYLVREYSKQIERFTVEDQMEFEKISKNTWRIYNHNKSSITLNYHVYGFETSVRTNFINADHAFIVPTATFLHIAGRIAEPVTVRFFPHKLWENISTGLEKIGQNMFYASDFDILYDSPIEIGNQDIWTIQASNVVHEFAMVGGGTYNKERLTADVKKIVEEETRIWGSNPNKRYVFITHNYQSGGGGLEHLNSTVLGASRTAYSNENSYKTYLSLIAHEYFHLWHVKRLRPKALGPFNYDQENYTTGLWIMEGFTSYYDNLILKRCDFFSEQEYLNLLANDFTTVLNRPGHLIQSAAEASFDSWVKYYRQDENSPNSSISYYNKGAMLTVLLDLKIIASSNGTKKLDDVLKAAYNHFYMQLNRGFEELEFQQLVEEVTGITVKEIFEAAHEHSELPYNHYFNLVGYEIIDINADSKNLGIGISYQKNDGIQTVTAVERGSSAWDGGLNVRDELIAINGIRLDMKDKEYDYFMQHSTAGELLDVLIARDGIIKNLKIEIRPNSKKLFRIQPLKEQSEEQKKLAQFWLS
ncbi:M61 family metallopeptidase [Sphingobacterium faecium]|uniref:M61 family metallopeptidase n=1 Tax=Sphingobacterium faecium TaxID=34087 RepID=UPI0024688BC9|nr:PDZ domain-containing protein [Sphingobacterium faecium]MDH5827664.1 PDZ domain-containing protein [Sphingobacterium faecium]